eukprot:Hpha_TRINITY_DN15472_c5_g4::TRINITY_DN15472_c5_g4_i1::g.175881::m.175881
MPDVLANSGGRQHIRAIQERVERLEAELRGLRISVPNRPSVNTGSSRHTPRTTPGRTRHKSPGTYAAGSERQTRGQNGVGGSRGGALTPRSSTTARSSQRRTPRRGGGEQSQGTVETNGRTPRGIGTTTGTTRVELDLKSPRKPRAFVPPSGWRGIKGLFGEPPPLQTPRSKDRSGTPSRARGTSRGASPSGNSLRRYGTEGQSKTGWSDHLLVPVAADNNMLWGSAGAGVAPQRRLAGYNSQVPSRGDDAADSSVHDHGSANGYRESPVELEAAGEYRGGGVEYGMHGADYSGPNTPRAADAAPRLRRPKRSSRPTTPTGCRSVSGSAGGGRYANGQPNSLDEWHAALKTSVAPPPRVGVAALGHFDDPAEGSTWTASRSPPKFAAMQPRELQPRGLQREETASSDWTASRSPPRCPVDHSWEPPPMDHSADMAMSVQMMGASALPPPPAASAPRAAHSWEAPPPVDHARDMDMSVQMMGMSAMADMPPPPPTSPPKVSGQNEGIAVSAKRSDVSATSWTIGLRNALPDIMGETMGDSGYSGPGGVQLEPIDPMGTPLEPDEAAQSARATEPAATPNQYRKVGTDSREQSWNDTKPMSWEAPPAVDHSADMAMSVQMMGASALDDMPPPPATSAPAAPSDPWGVPPPADHSRDMDMSVQMMGMSAMADIPPPPSSAAAPAAPPPEPQNASWEAPPPVDHSADMEMSVQMMGMSAMGNIPPPPAPSAPSPTAASKEGQDVAPTPEQRAGRYRGAGRGGTIATPPSALSGGLREMQHLGALSAAISVGDSGSATPTASGAATPSPAQPPVLEADTELSFDDLLSRYPELRAALQDTGFQADYRRAWDTSDRRNVIEKLRARGYCGPTGE